MKNLEIKEIEKKQSFYTPKNLEKLSIDIKQKLEKKKNPSFLEKLKNLF